MLLHPEVADRDCGHCQRFVYLEETGAPMRQTHGQPDADGLLPIVVRHERNLPPCRALGQSCPKGSPEKQRSLSEKNRRAFRHYQICKATGKWPDDGIVRQNAGIIEAAFMHAEISQRCRTKKQNDAIVTLLSAAIKARAM